MRKEKHIKKFLITIVGLFLLTSIADANRINFANADVNQSEKAISRHIFYDAAGNDSDIHFDSDIYNTTRLVIFGSNGTVMILENFTVEHGIRGNDTLIISPDLDVTTELGRAKIGFITGFPNYAFFSHYDMDSSTNFGLLQTNDGTSYLNSPASKYVYLADNGVQVARIDDLEFNIQDLTLKFGTSWGSEDIEVVRISDQTLNMSSAYGDAFLEVDGQVNSSGGNSVQWTEAYSWGDHSLIGYLTDWTDGDPFYNASIAKTLQQAWLDNWNTSYGWGNHGIVGYITNLVGDGDPFFNASDAFPLQASWMTGWNASGEGFWNDDGSTLFTSTSGRNIDVNATITGNTLTDGTFSVTGGAVTGATGANNMWTNDAGYLTTWTDGDPFFNATDTEAELESHIGDVTNIFTDNDGALNDDDVTLVDVQGACTNDFHNIGGADATDDTVSGTELDALLFGNNGLLRRTGANTFDTITDSSSNWDTAHGWGDHSIVGYLTSTFWNRAGTTLYPATNNDDIHINGTSTFDENVTINDTMTLTNTTSAYSWDIYVDTNGTMVWKWTD